MICEWVIIHRNNNYQNFVKYKYNVANNKQIIQTKIDGVGCMKICNQKVLKIY